MQGRGFAGERGGRLGWAQVHRGSFGFAQNRLFALERRAQDDSKNRQREELAVDPPLARKKRRLVHPAHGLLENALKRFGFQLTAMRYEL